MNTKPDKAPTVHVDEAGFESEVLKSELPVLAAFWAPWSRPCHVLDSVLDEVATACAGSIKIVKVNADDNPDLSLWYEIQSIPTLVVFVDGQIRAKVVGTASKEAILSRLQSVLRRSDSPSPTPDADPAADEHRT
jgi:thioredoxin 1